MISIQNKTTISEANVKTNRIVSTKCTYYKERSFASNSFIFLKVLLQFKNLFLSWFDVPKTQMPIPLLFVSAGVLFDGAFFPVSILNDFLMQETWIKFHRDASTSHKKFFFFYHEKTSKHWDKMYSVLPLKLNKYSEIEMRELLILR